MPTRKQKGDGFADFARKANEWLRKTKAISKVANTLATVGVPYAGNIGQVAGKLGYGKRVRKRTGGARKSTGGARKGGARKSAGALSQVKF